MNSLGSIAVFDLAKIGTAYLIINSFVDEAVIQVFEVSPIGGRAVLILRSADSMALEFAYRQCLTLHKADILNHSFIPQLDENIMSCYLSQNHPTLKKHLFVAEEHFLSTAFNIATSLTEEAFTLIDFRVVRTDPPNIIITSSDDSIERLNLFMQKNNLLKATLIANVQKPLQAYFQIIK